MRIAFVATWKTLFAAIAGAVVLAFAVSLSGLVPIAASSGHFGPVGWFLHFTMQNVVDRQSMLIEVPEDIDLDDPALVRRSVGHFATGCAACHGAPGVPQSPVVLSMTPPPPRLEAQVPEWEDRELFWIVKHGIKYSGMPAWPTLDRDDEVWAQVAFLRALPEMTPQIYADLALGGARPTLELEAGGETLAALDGIVEEALADCARCHGRDGLGAGPDSDAFPVIAGQPEPYLFATLQAFAEGDRHSGFMQPPARRYPEDVLRRLAAWYAGRPTPGGQAANPVAPPQAGLPPSSPEEPGTAATDAPQAAREDGIPPQILPAEARTDNQLVPAAAAGGLPEEGQELLALGRLIAERGIPSRKIPACESCHGAAERDQNPLYPYLAGQPEWYARTHLHLWKEDDRGGTRFSHLMRPIAINLTDEQIDAVAAWYASLPAGR
ncbi:c-type cytochrome [Aurantimonas aggregata]|uniref:C-type cytochrome n=1 Tax=Aurantimonas aggregata TaxID=2047720 RepID=A0A6L9MMY9_9HYPH|nr:c-type cytochrome [Aurantimonas aggregata]NDV88870.1 c-type cytochrome [Aurantimonas aggregata]